jgi:hypothetical protein
VDEDPLIARFSFLFYDHLGAIVFKIAVLLDHGLLRLRRNSRRQAKGETRPRSRTPEHAFVLLISKRVCAFVCVV